MKATLIRDMCFILFAIEIIQAGNQRTWSSHLLGFLTPYMKSYSPVHVVFPDEHFANEETEKEATTLLRELHDLTSGLTVLQSGGDLHQEELAYSPFLVLVILVHGTTNQLTQLQSALYVLLQSSGWNTRLPHVIIIEKESTDNEETEVIDISTELWNHKVSHASILTVLASNISTGVQQVNVHWWEPLGFGSDCLGPRKSAIQTAPLSKGLPSLLFGSLPNYWKGCHLQAASLYNFLPFIIENPDPGPNKPLVVDGLDFRIASEMSSRLNITVGYAYANWLEGPAMLRNSSADLLLGSYIILPWWYPEHDRTVVYWVKQSMWFVPSGLPVPRWLSVAFVFSSRLWLLVIVSSTATIVTFALYRASGRHDDMPKTLHVLFMLLGVCSDKEPSGILPCLLFLSWLLGTFILNNSYQSGLVGMLVNPGTFAPISSMQELVDSGLKIGLHAAYITKLHEFDEEPMFKTFLERSVECLDMQECMDRVAIARDMAVPFELTWAEYAYNGRGRKMIKLLEAMGTWNCVMYFVKGNPLNELWDFYLNGLIQSSILEFWWKDLMSSQELLGFSPSGPSDPIVMKLEHVGGPFLILFIGLGLSTFVFVAENIIQKIKFTKYLHQNEV